MNFKGFYGNERAKDYITSAFARDSFPHSLLIAGDRGIGKMTLARIIAKALVCGNEEKPRSKCNSCLKAERDIHPDIAFLGCDGSSIKVDHIRDLKRDALLRPNDADRKVYIINNAGSMTHDAQDALLKILEEPPLFTFFILLCYNYSDLLPTIVSRTATLTLSPLNEQDMMKVIKEKLPEISDAEARELIRTSGGICSFLKDTESSEATELAGNIAEALISRNDFELFKAFSALEKLGRDMLISVLDELTVVFRDAIVISVNSGSRTISSMPGHISKKLSELFSPSNFSAFIEHISSAKAEATRNVGVAHITGSLICKFAHTAAIAALKG